MQSGVLFFDYYSDTYRIVITIVKNYKHFENTKPALFTLWTIPKHCRNNTYMTRSLIIVVVVIRSPIGFYRSERPLFFGIDSFIDRFVIGSWWW